MAVSLFGRILSKTGGIFISVLQYGCIAHCSLEFVADFVSVSKIKQILFWLEIETKTDLFFIKYI